MKKDSVMTGASPPAEPIVRIRGLRKSFGNHVVLNGIDFDVLPSQVVVVIGPSGSGKSTFLRCCNGLEQPEGGTVEICGRTLVQDGRMLPDHDLNALREEVGMVFQSFNLFPHLSVLDNVAGTAREIVMLNAGTALYVANRAESIGQGIELAREAVASGAARAKLDAFARFTQACAA